MLLINNLTIDEINAALISLQRNAKDKVQTVETSTQTSQDNSETINELKAQVNSMQNSVAANAQSNEYLSGQVNNLNNAVAGLASAGIQSLVFDDNTRQLELTTNYGQVFSCTIGEDYVQVTYNHKNDTLTF